MAFSKNYKITWVRKDSQGQPISTHVTNHESGVVMGLEGVNVTLEHLPDEPSDPSSKVLRLTIRET